MDRYTLGLPKIKGKDEILNSDSYQFGQQVAAIIRQKHIHEAMDRYILGPPKIKGEDEVPNNDSFQF